MEKRIAFYLRCSTSEQEHKYQEDILTSQLTKECTFVGIYKEKLSGFKKETERPEMNKLLNDIRNGKINCVMATEFTRISRDVLNLLTIIKELNGLKCNLYIHKEGLNTLDSEGNVNVMVQMIISVFAQFGQIEAEALKYRMKNGKLSSALSGNYIGGNLIYGYSYINKGIRDKEIIIDSYQKEIVLRIFNSFVIQGKTLNKITAELNIDKVKTKTKFIERKNKDENFLEKVKNTKWSMVQVRSILLSKMYIGINEYTENIGTKEYPVYKSYEIKLSKELIFNELNEVWEGDTIWNKAQEKLITNKNASKPHRGNIFLLSDKMYCGECGKKMIIKYLSQKTKTVKKEIKNYYCKSRFDKRFGIENECKNNKYIELSKLDKMIWLLILNKSNALKELVNESENDNSNESEINELNNKIESANSEIENKKSKRKNLQRYAADNGETDDFKNDIKVINTDIQQLNRIIVEYKSRINEIQIEKQNYSVLDNVIEKLSEIEKDKTLQKNYINKIIKKIEVYNDSKNIILKVIFFNNDCSYILYDSNDKVKTNSLY